ncbi:MAG: DUF1302 domain-containing protein [Nevskiales bacterium]
MRDGACVLRMLAALCALLFSTTSSALNFEFDDGAITLELISKFSLGGGWRLEERDNALLGKLNVPGQQDLCTADDCLSFNHDPGPNARLVAADGGFFLHVTDDGNLNYDKGDPVSGLAKLNSELNAKWAGWTLKLSGIGFFDTVNADFSERHANTRSQPRFTDRPERIEDGLAKDIQYREAFIARSFELFDKNISAAIGYQRVRWGEANLHLFNTLDEINPLDAILARQPGLALNELNVPTGMALFGIDLTEALNLETFYQFDWEPVRPDATGSFFSTSDIAGGGRTANIHLGQLPEDPDGDFRLAGLAAFVTSTSSRVFISNEKAFAPDEGGQYGLRLNWYLENLNNGTQFGFYAMNYHSRLPLASMYAANRSCLRDALIPGDIVTAAVACQGFNGTLNLLGIGREPLPLDTVRVRLDYPEDIHLFGASFNTTGFGWSFSGEYSYRPNQPAQLLISDVLLAAVQPALPTQDIPIGVGVIPGLSLGTIPGARTFAPDFISPYRGQAIQANQYIPGFERLKVGQLVVNGIKLIAGENIFRAEDITVLIEAGFTHVVDLPEAGELFFQGGGDSSHPSPGEDGSGDPPGTSHALRINPTQMKEGWAEDFAWGLRSLVMFNYSNVWDSGITLKPTILWSEDIKGIAPSPAQNYVEGNRWIVLGSFVEYGEDWSGNILFNHFAGERNLLADRDSVFFSVAYSF